MSKKLIVFLLPSLMFLTSACDFAPFSNPGNRSQEEILSLIKARFAQVEAANSFHGGVLIAFEGNTIFHEAYGQSGAGELNSPTASFNIASMGKMFTGVAVMKYVQDGKLRLDQTIADWLPDYANQAAAQSISIHHLLTHTSGIPDIFSYENLQQIDQSEIQTWYDYFPYFESSDLEFKPGKKFSYSNSAYLVLGAILEAVAQKDYCSILDETVFVPADMDEAVCGWPFGGAEISLSGMLDFTTALLNAQLLTSSTTELMTTAKEKISRKVYYCYGFHEEFDANSREISHKGGNQEIKSQTMMFPETGYTIIIYANNNAIGYEAFDDLRAYLKEILS